MCRLGPLNVPGVYAHTLSSLYILPGTGATVTVVTGFTVAACGLAAAGKAIWHQAMRC